MAMMDTEHMEGSEDAMMAGTGEWTEEEMAEMAMHDGDDMMMSETTDAMMSETVGEYVVYNGTSFPKNDHVVLFFHATWCPSCKSADTNLSASEIPAGYSIVKVDYDTYGDLKQKYGIVSQHTFVVVDVNGEMIKKWVGASTIDDVVDGVQG
ncbi:MAG: thioredoxin family protein [Candidatus Peribacteria bacterium]|nr:MAG: thioredoxin family protein [Candidatus Peribacteria bacterium]